MSASTPPSGKELPPLRQRLNKAIVDFSGQLAGMKSGALVQVWMPEQCSDGTVVLSAQGLPFAVVGVGDLLALFRCVSVRYRFSTDVMRPSLMGAIGRVYATMEPEMSHDVQKYDKQVYLRVSEAQRCRVHSALMVPVFEQDTTDKPLAVFELVQSEKDVIFPQVMSCLATCLEAVALNTVKLEQFENLGLRQWPMHVEEPEASKGNIKLGVTSSGDIAAAEGTVRGGKALQTHDPTEATSNGSGDKARVSSSDGLARSRLDRMSRESLVDSDRGGQRTHDGRGGTSSGNNAIGQANMETETTPGSASAQSGGSRGKNNDQVANLMSMLQDSNVNPAMLQTLKSLLNNTGGAAGGQATNQSSQAVPAASVVAAGKVAGKGSRQQGLQRTSSARNIKAEDNDNDDDDFSSGNDDSDSDDGDGNGKANNRVGGGAGKRLRYEELQAQFGLGLKEAAANLGICATTLKRACRRHGIKRWPRRQIVKLSKALNQMGYQGAPPKALVQSAVTGQIAGTDAAAAAAAAVTGANATPAQQKQLAALLTAAVGKQAGNGTAAGPGEGVPLHPVLQALGGQSNDGSVQQSGGVTPGAQQPAATPGLQHVQQMMSQGSGGLMNGPGMNPMMPMMMMPHPNSMAMMMMQPGMNPYMQQHLMASMQHAAMQQQGQRNLPGVQQPTTPHQGLQHSSMPAGSQPSQTSGQQHSQTSLNRMASSGPYSPMNFLFQEGNHSGGHALVNELVPPAHSGGVPTTASLGGLNSAAMQTSHDLLAGVKSSGMPCGFDMNYSSTFNMPTAELLQGLGDTDVGPNANNAANSQAQIAAMHELFKNATGSLENIMELFSEDLPVIH